MLSCHPPQFCHPTQNILPWPPQKSFGTPPLKTFCHLTPTRFLPRHPFKHVLPPHPRNILLLHLLTNFCHPSPKYFTTLPPKNICHFTINKFCHRTSPNIFTNPTQIFLPLHPQFLLKWTRRTALNKFYNTRKSSIKPRKLFTMFTAI